MKEILVLSVILSTLSSILAQPDPSSDPDSDINLAFHHTLYNFRPKSIFNRDDPPPEPETYNSFDLKSRSGDIPLPSTFTPQQLPTPDRHRVYDPNPQQQDFDQLLPNFDRTRVFRLEPQRRINQFNDDDDQTLYNSDRLRPSYMPKADRARLDRDRPDQRKYYYGSPIVPKSIQSYATPSRDGPRQSKSWNDLHEYGKRAQQSSPVDDEANFIKKMSLDGPGGFFVFTRTSPNSNPNGEDDRNPREREPRPQYSIGSRQSPPSYNFPKDISQSYTPHPRQYPAPQNEEPPPPPPKTKPQYPSPSNGDESERKRGGGGGRGKIFEPDGAGITIVIRKNRRGQVGFGVRGDDPNSDDRDGNPGVEGKTQTTGQDNDKQEEDDNTQKPPWAAAADLRAPSRDHVRNSTNTRAGDVSVSEALKFEAKKLKLGGGVSVYRYIF